MITNTKGYRESVFMILLNDTLHIIYKYKTF